MPHSEGHPVASAENAENADKKPEEPPQKKTLQETTQYTQCTRLKSSRNHGSGYICITFSVPSTCSTGWFQGS